VDRPVADPDGVRAGSVLGEFVAGAGCLVGVAARRIGPMIVRQFRSIAGSAIRAAVGFPGRLIRHEVAWPKRSDFRPSHPRDWTIRTRLIVSSAVPVAIVAALELVTGHLGVLTLVVLVGACVSSVYVARSVARPIEVVTQRAVHIATGDLSELDGVTISGQGELGRLAEAFGGIRQYMEELAALADRVAAGDLTREVTTRSEQDGLAQAFRYMIARLRKMITEMGKAAASVADTAVRVNDAAALSEAGTSQISQTIGQVAAGAADQARVSTDTSMAMLELGQVIDQVGSGAARTASSVDAQADAIGQMAVAIREATTASDEVNAAGRAAGTAADKGALAVRETASGMARIKQAVDTGTVVVTNLGAKGTQIGAIVQTIEDIADQTNLLALNAAIEAARAGEQGKGFAVVADEVRKLAERSRTATKEIAALISEVQKGTAQAVAAMEIGAREVASGSSLAERSAAALDEIAAAVAASNAAVARITVAVGAMESSSANVVAASDTIAAIAATTNEAAGSMSASALRVNDAVESIAAISEENSASAEEVSAATAELSEQSQGVFESASTLTEASDKLRRLVNRWRLPEDESEDGASSQRNAA
jgi:methyl-accepting chemotaxis protein